MSGRFLLLMAGLAAVSSACRASPPGGTAATPAVTTTIPQTAPAPLSDLMGPSAPLLVALGGQYLCDQRIYSPPPGPHISAWEWAFDDDPEMITEKLAQRLSGVEREGSTFRWKGADGAVQAVVTLKTGRSHDSIAQSSLVDPKSCRRVAPLARLNHALRVRSSLRSRTASWPKAPTRQAIPGAHRFAAVIPPCSPAATPGGSPCPVSAMAR